MAGSAPVRNRSHKDFTVHSMSRKDVDFLDEKLTLKFIDSIQPKTIVIAAAKVDGKCSNLNYPIGSLKANLRIQQS